MMDDEREREKIESFENNEKVKVMARMACGKVRPEVMNTSKRERERERRRADAEQFGRCVGGRGLEHELFKCIRAERKRSKGHVFPNFLFKSSSTGHQSL
jgi:hypothetical protein